jgi:hypothetical protein
MLGDAHHPSLTSLLFFQGTYYSFSQYTGDQCSGAFTEAYAVRANECVLSFFTYENRTITGLIYGFVSRLVHESQKTHHSLPNRIVTCPVGESKTIKGKYFSDAACTIPSDVLPEDYEETAGDCIADEGSMLTRSIIHCLSAGAKLSIYQIPTYPDASTSRTVPFLLSSTRPHLLHPKLLLHPPLLPRLLLRS